MKPRSKATLLEDFHLLSYDSLDSTNEEARRLAEGGASHGAVIWAKKQTDGRGRQGREWVSNEGNLFVSILLSPDCDLVAAAQLSFVAGISVLDTLQPIIDDAGALTCKWPNDIMLNDRKLGGILLESFRTVSNEPGHNKTTQWVTVGIGLNIDSCPDNTDIPAAFLKEAGVEIVSAKIVLSRFVHHFIQRYDQWANKGFSTIRRDWLKHAWRLGEEIQVRAGNQKVTGLFDGIDPQGQLLLKDKSRKKLTLSAGDVFFEEEKV